MNVTNSVSPAIRFDICVTFEPATLESFANFRKIVWLSREHSGKGRIGRLYSEGIGRMSVLCTHVRRFSIHSHITCARVKRADKRTNSPLIRLNVAPPFPPLEVGVATLCLTFITKRLVEFTLNGKRAWKRYSVDYIFVLCAVNCQHILPCKKSAKNAKELIRLFHFLLDWEIQFLLNAFIQLRWSRK